MKLKINKEVFLCCTCGTLVELTQLRLPTGDGISFRSMEHPPELLNDIADAIQDGRLCLNQSKPH